MISRATFSASSGVIQVFQNDGEFVAAEARHGVLRADRLLQARRRGAQDRSPAA
jgi:hypothetical protein